MGMLDDKVVVVSGIGPGLGQALARRAADHGAAGVVLASRTQENLDELSAKLNEAGGKALAVRTDITNPDDVQNLVRATLDEFGRVDAVINNAFVMPPMSGLTNMDEEATRKSIDVTLYGSLRVTSAFTPALIESQGSVLFVNSVVIRHTRVGYGPYRIAKAALEAAAQNLATELGPRGVRVNSIAPGWIGGHTLERAFDKMSQARGVSREQIEEEILATIDLRRFPMPDDIADAGLFLCSPLAHAITKQTLEVSCGEFHT
ncbi:SDR family oxidoreductase [Enemella sp. A6]|uniref:SDR family oxidoreductase n=1 Tax=Enemella sp. A6 TaxID=3440152 RepID=UPI003EB7855F